MGNPTRSLFTSVLLFGLFVGSPAHAAGQYNVVELTFQSRFGKLLTLDIGPEGGYSASACNRSLADVKAAYAPDYVRAIKKNYGYMFDDFVQPKLVDIKCQAYEFPPGQTLILKLGQ